MGYWSVEAEASEKKNRKSPKSQFCRQKNKGKQSTCQEGIQAHGSFYWYQAIMSSLPMVLQSLARDSKDLISQSVFKLIDFILPKWSREHPNTLPSMKELLEVASSTLSPSEFLLRNFDTNGDGHISSAELLNMTEILKHNMVFVQRAPETWASWFRREWPLMDWKIGVFVWRSFGGILFLLAFLSFVPGRLHGISGKALRWPILGLTYFLIGVELV